VAERDGDNEVAIGVQAGDWERWADCRPAFVSAMFEALRIATEGRVRVRAPYQRTSKLDVIRRGRDLGVPFELTWSCYRDGEEPCGECPACLGRREALYLAGAT
jgi:7-cyano-7-deazaguanine synthase